MSAPRILIYLLRRDLRLADNPIFHEVSRLAKQSQPPFTHLLPLYVFPAQQVEVSGFLSSPDAKSPYPQARSQAGGFWRCGPHRATFLAETVWDLKTSLDGVGSGLELRVGMLGDVVRDLLAAFKKTDGQVVEVWMTNEEGVEEKREERDVRRLVEAEHIKFKLWVDEKYLIDDRDVPLKSPKDLPDVFTSYRKMVEPLRDAPRATLPKPSTLIPLPPSSMTPTQSSPFTIPSNLDDLVTALHKPLEKDLGLKNPPTQPKGTESAHPFHGGESAGHERIRHLVTSGSMTGYKDSRNGLLGEDFSTKLSAWLALGCVTARQVHQSLVEFEDGTTSLGKGVTGYGKGENKGTTAVRFELLWRDYMRLCTRKFGPRLFRVSGFRDDHSVSWSYASDKNPVTQEKIRRFLEGTTGTGLIDASQRELYLTGYTSNRARQNVASFLAKHLGVDWRVGAEWYECLLADYDVSSNWGNWQYVAGVGNDPRGEGRVFNPVKQAYDYDPQGEYVKAWVDEARALGEVGEIFQPWTVPPDRRQELGLAGREGVERPLKRIEFHVKGPGRGRGGGRGGDSGRGGGGSGGGRGRGFAGRGRGNSDGRGQRRRGLMEKGA
ncbi:MAG: hypothetical protein M1817_003787 [Caeruleum heppii]|nr:MAG: hypothetical protein M1817_003787 [Caeruleum heppii]